MNISKTGTSKVFCCVYGCRSKGTRNRELSFHFFPKQGSLKVPFENKDGNIQSVDIRIAWILTLKMGKPVSQSMKVCSLHFKKEDFSHFDLDRKRRVLKKHAVPSCNLPMSSSRESSAKKRVTGAWRNKDVKKEREDIEPEEIQFQDPVEPNIDDEYLMDISASVSETQPDDYEAARILCSLGQDCKSTRKDVAVQVTTGDFQYNFLDSITSDKKLSSITGLPSLTLLQTLTELVTDELTEKKVSRLKLDVKTRVVMTFMKFKTNISYSLLSIIFNSTVTPTMCKNICYECIQILAYVLQPVIHFQSLDEIALHRPACFADFQSVRVVLDCTEIRVEKPKCLCCQLKLYSSYKQTTTMKYLVGVAPSGLITFVSLGYGGRTSDKAIFEQSDMVNKLTPGRDEVMVDKGFLIDDICQPLRIKVIRPPFLRKNTQLSAEDARITRQIAQARIHIERINQRIKVFKIFSTTFPTHLIQQIDNIFFIICAITNLSAPILAENRF